MCKNWSNFFKKYTLKKMYHNLKRFLQFSIIFKIHTYLRLDFLLSPVCALVVSEKPFKKSFLVPGHHGIYRYKRNHLSTRQRLLKKSNELLEASFAKMSSLQVFMAKSKLTDTLRTGGNHHRYKIRPCMETNTTYT